MATDNENGRRVLITGVGIFSPIGIGREEFAQSLAEGKGGVGPTDLFETTVVPGKIGGQVRDFTESTAKKQYLKSVRKSIKVMCRDVQMGVASAAQAIQDAGLDDGSIDPERMGVDFGANLMLSPPTELAGPGIACIEGANFIFERWGETGLGSMEPLWMLKFLPNMPACHIGIMADARGPNNSVTLDEVSGPLALGEGASVVSRGWADLMIAGATGTRIQPVRSIHAVMWDDLAYDEQHPEQSCRPFDVERSGQVVGEAACSFILESAEHAEQRGANVLGEFLGSGSSCVVGPDGTPNRQRALVNAMHMALRAAGLQPSDIGHINAHGLGTRDDDRLEAAAIHDVFGSDASKIPVTSLKGYFGNTGAACGAIELAGSLLSLKNGTIPATLNCRAVDSELELDVVGEARETDNPVVMKINFTRAGQAGVAIVRSR